MRRVTTGPLVVLTFDLAVHEAQWLVTDYLPEIAALDRTSRSPAEIAEALGGGRVEVVPVPHDCTDGFCHAWWRRPEAYLDPRCGPASPASPACPGRGGGRAWSPGSPPTSPTAPGGPPRRPVAPTEIDAGYRLVVIDPLTHTADASSR